MSRTAAVILAAGKGTRLKTQWPKVLHEVLGRPMLAHVFDACRAADVRELIAVIGYEKEKVKQAFSADRDVCWVEQNEQKGTGHAVMMCREALSGFEHALVLCGDGPLIRAQTVRELLARHREEANACTLATAEIDDPSGYGRILRNAAGGLTGIVEHGDCNPEQRRIREVNPSYYCFRVADLLEALTQITPNNAKSEYYLTDCVSVLLTAGRRVGAVTAVPPEDIFSINSRQDLALVNRVMRQRVNREWMDNGVTIVDPDSTWIDARARIGADTIIYPFSYIFGAARIGGNCRIGPFANLAGDARIADGAVVANSAGGAR